MCNPRRVMIHLDRCIEEAWRQTVEQAATVTGEVAELARINAEVPLDEEMGDAALIMLERVLAGEFEGFEPWQRDSTGRYHRDLNEVTMSYDPASHQLSIEARLTDLVTAEARAAAEASGTTVGQVAVEAMGSYYDDGWGGRTRERALEEAQQEAEQRLREAAERMGREQHSAELEEARSRAGEEARRLAEEELVRRQEALRGALRERLQVIMAQAEERVYHVMNRAVGEAYRQTLRQLVLETGGRILADEQTGSIINLELELY
jgi:Skp family chaperone for outer membrane proteins